MHDLRAPLNELRVSPKHHDVAIEDRGPAVQRLTCVSEALPLPVVNTTRYARPLVECMEGSMRQ